MAETKKAKELAEKYLYEVVDKWRNNLVDIENYEYIPEGWPIQFEAHVYLGHKHKDITHKLSNEVRLRFHDLRHTFASRMVEKGCDIETLRDLLGHHSVTVTQRYVHTDLDRKKAAVGLLGTKRAEKSLDLS